MSDVPADIGRPRRSASAEAGWMGWLGFAATMMVMLGSFNIVYGLVALMSDDFYAVGPEGTLVFDLTGWGWIQLILGLVVVGTGVALARGSQWARIVTVILASLNAVTQLAFMSVYPVWSLIAIGFDVLIIWAVIVHGDPAAEEEAGA
ncbi:MAG: hypothetical protein WBA97_06645 [Actinophytocola sp.]|uniref:DUF7144 family membrane protein n=1 Tax=Actinophytocola sp. TaxID=1872138 RepID=UPI003C7544E3